MAQIHILDSETIDKIAAGEVVERPSSVVKELVENAIDAGAVAVTVEAKDGGIEFIRVTDNGCGMEREQLRTAFLRHATSKIIDASDLMRIRSLGFRGEALSSIAAVAKVEVITKTPDSITGSRILLEGAKEVGFDEVGAPEGTTFLVRNLFFNTPVRRKFLKQPATEGGYIADLMEHLALSRPDISFKFVLGNQMRFHTSGNGDLREVIYRVYGRDVANALVPIQAEKDGVRVEGYLGKPEQVRSNRNFEIYFINGRFIRSNVVSRAIEEGYKEYLMQHKFPLCVLHITMDTDRVDVNVHPTKMDVRFSEVMQFSDFLIESVRDTLKNREMIPEASLSMGRELKDARKKEAEALEALRGRQCRTPEPFEKRRAGQYRAEETAKYNKEPWKQNKSSRQAGNPGGRDFAESPAWSRVKASPEAGSQAVPQNMSPQESGTVQQKELVQDNKAAQQKLPAEDDFFTETTEFAFSTPAQNMAATEAPAEMQGGAVSESEAMQNGAGAPAAMQGEAVLGPAAIQDGVAEPLADVGSGAVPGAAIRDGVAEPLPDVGSGAVPGSAAMPEQTETQYLEPAAALTSAQPLVSGEQMDLFEEKILTADNRSRFRIIGQVFGTYWLIEFEDKLMMIDQHAAHEKVNYERLMKQFREKNVVSQSLLPPVVVSLSGQEENILKEHMEVFLKLGFEVEHFGGSEYALRSVPVDLYGCDEREMFLAVLDQLADGVSFGGVRVIEEKIASMSCKAAVKGNSTLSAAEAESLIDELLTLENPYNCPHGRPTIVAMTRAEMDRKFKRIVS